MYAYYGTYHCNDHLTDLSMQHKNSLFLTETASHVSFNQTSFYRVFLIKQVFYPVLILLA